MKIKVEIENLENAGCNNGRYPAYRLLNEEGQVVGEGITCNCGRGCSGTDDVSEYQPWQGPGPWVIVYDEGHEVFGVFASMADAEKAVAESDPDWWATGPVYEPWKNAGEFGESVELECGCIVSWYDWKWSPPYPDAYATCPQCGDSFVK